MRNSYQDASFVYLARSATKIFSASNLSLPNPHCPVCRVVYLPISLDPSLTLGKFVEKVVVGELGMDGHVTVQQGARVLFETEDFEDNEGKMMSDVGLGEGSFVVVLDDDEPRYPVSFSISACVLPLLSSSFRTNIVRRPLPDSTIAYRLGAPIPVIPMKAPVEVQIGRAPV